MLFVRGMLIGKGTFYLRTRYSMDTEFGGLGDSVVLISPQTQ